MKTRTLLRLKLTFTMAGILCIIAGCSKGSPEPNSDPGPDPDPETIEVIRISKMEAEKKTGIGGTETFLFSYNDRGFMTKLEIINGVIHESHDIEYDAENKITQIGGVHYFYDSKGRVTKSTLPPDATGFDRQIIYTYNDQDLVVASLLSRSVINGAGETITTHRLREYEYYPDGKLRSVLDQFDESERVFLFLHANDGKEVKCEVSYDNGVTFTQYLTYMFIYGGATNPNMLIRNSMGLDNGISAVLSPILPHSMATAFGGDLYYHNSNVVRTMKHIQHVGTTYTHTTTHEYAYSFNEDDIAKINPVKIEHTRESPNTPEDRWEYNITHETLTIEK